MPTHVQTSYDYCENGTTATLYNFSVGSGSNRTLVARIAIRDFDAGAPQVNSVVFNSNQNFTFRGRTSYNWSTNLYDVAEIWTLDNPANATGNVVATLNEDAGGGIIIMVSEYTGANNGVGPNVGNASGSANTYSVTFTTGSSDSLILAALEIADGDVATGITPGSGVTERAEITSVYIQNSGWAGDKAATGGSDTISASTSSSYHYAMVAIELKAPSASATQVTAAEGSCSVSGDAVSLTITQVTYITVAKGIVATLGDAALPRHITPLVVSESQVAVTSDPVIPRHITPLAVAEGNAAATGDTAVLRTITPITIAEGQMAVTGDPVILSSVTITYITVAEGSISVAGDAAVLRAITALTIAEGSSTVTGDAVTLRAITPLSVADGYVAVTGDAAQLSFSGIGATYITLAEGNVAVIGDTVVARHITPLAVAEGNVAVTGDAVTMTFGIVSYLTVAEGVCSIVGDAATLRALYPITANEGTLTVTGDTAVLRALYPLIVDGGNCQVSGDKMNIIIAALILHGARHVHYPGIRRMDCIMTVRQIHEVDDD